MKRIVVLTLLNVFVLVVSGCGHTHEWSTTICTEKGICSKCNEVREAALDHTWTEATCESSKICSVCGVQGGDPLGHDIVFEEWSIVSDETGTSAYCARCNSIVQIEEDLLPLVEEDQLLPVEQQELFGNYTVDELLSELSLNAFRAEQTFQDKYICLTGVLQTIDSDGEYFSLEPLEQEWFSFDSILCYFTSDEQREVFLNYNQGDILSINCQVADIGEIIGYTVNIIEIFEGESDDPISGEYMGCYEDVSLLIWKIDDSTYSLSYSDMVGGNGVYDIPSARVDHREDGAVSIMFWIDDYDPEHKGYVEIMINTSDPVFTYSYNSLIDGVEDTGGYYAPLTKKDW